MTLREHHYLPQFAAMNNNPRKNDKASSGRMPDHRCNAERDAQLSNDNSIALHPGVHPGGSSLAPGAAVVKHLFATYVQKLKLPVIC